MPEDITLWEIVEETNPNYESIPDEVKENLENQMVEESDLLIDSLFTLNYVQLCIIIFAFISIVLILKI